MGSIGARAAQQHDNSKKTKHAQELRLTQK